VAVSAAVIDTARDADAAEVAVVVRTAFHKQPHVDDLVAAIRASAQYEPELALAARWAGSVVGFVMISHAELVDDGAHHDVLTLSPLAVAPASQRQGIGSALVRAVLQRADERRDLPRLVTLEGNPRFYRPLGFEHAADFGVSMDLPDGVPVEAAQVYRLSGHDPVIRGRVSYPPAFAVL
jgi:putative acetyltransferase